MTLSSNQIQSWTGLPEHVKRQAAPEILRGVEWHYYGRHVANPGEKELRRLALPLRQGLRFFPSTHARAKKNRDKDSAIRRSGMQ